MFGDKLRQGDGVAIGLNCGFCNKPAERNHTCPEMQQKLKELEEQQNGKTQDS